MGCLFSAGFATELPFASFCRMLIPDQVPAATADAGKRAWTRRKPKRMEVYFDNLTAKNAPLDKLAEDVSLLVQDAEELVHASGAKLSPESQAELEDALERVKTLGERIKRQALASARATDRIIRQYPYHSLGTIFALGVLLGFLLRRK